MPENNWSLESLFKEGIASVLFEGLKYAFTVGLPILGAAVTLISGYFYRTQVPLPYLLAAASVVFAAVGVGLLRFEEWRGKRTAADKLAFGGTQVAFDYIRDASGAITGIEYAQVNAVLQNKAAFPIFYIVEEISSSVDGRVNQNPKNIVGSMLPPSHIQFIRQDRIDMKGDAPKPRIEAKLKLKLRYGRKGKEKYHLDKSAVITCVFDSNTGYIHQVPADATQ